jgi:hypothetical protein
VTIPKKHAQVNAQDTCGREPLQKACHDFSPVTNLMTSEEAMLSMSLSSYVLASLELLTAFPVTPFSTASQPFLAARNAGWIPASLMLCLMHSHGLQVRDAEPDRRVVPPSLCSWRPLQGWQTPHNSFYCTSTICAVPDRIRTKHTHSRHQKANPWPQYTDLSRKHMTSLESASSFSLALGVQHI